MFRHSVFGFVLLLTFLSYVPRVAAQDIDFVERFALSSDRQSTLSELVPGTDAYYFYHCLYYQNMEQYDQAEAMLKTWEKRRGNNEQLKQMRHRQALLTYGDNPQRTLDYLVDKLDVQFNHQRQRPSAEPGLPTALDPDSIGFERLNRRALGRDNLSRYEAVALPLAASQDLNDAQLRDLLKRLDHPVVDNLPALVARDLSNRDAEPFGNYTVHRLMLTNQLDELARLRPEISNEDGFVNIYLTKLAPDNDVVWQFDQQEHVAYLERLWSFVSELTPNHNSLKACVLYRRLELDLAMGVYNKERFLEYLKLPRQTRYVRDRLVKDVKSSRHLANLGANFSQQTRLAPVQSDEALVRHFLQHFLVDAADESGFRDWINETWLKEQFAEAKITSGLGDVEQWASLLSPAKYQELMKRVDLEFGLANARQFDVDQPVELQLYTKNVRNLIVKIFEINTGNFYRNQAGEINTDINLDGLVPNWQKTFDYDEPAIQRVARTFRFDEIDRRGVYVIDFIGSGQSCRVLVRKGSFFPVVETTAAGHQFAVLNEKNEVVTDARLWISGREYTPDESGQFAVPFSSQPGRQAVIIEHDGLSVRDHFNHLSESYSLQAGIYVDRESLLAMGTAAVIVRPQLRVSGQPAPVGLIDNARLVVRATDLDGVETTREFADFEMAEEYETSVEIMVPARLKSIHFQLVGTVENVSQGEPQTVSATQSYHVNQVDATESLQSVHLRRNDEGYFLSVRGKTGEARRAQAVVAKFKHRLFADTVTANLQSDENGQIQLGQLADIDYIQVSLNGQNERTWHLKSSDQSSNRSLHVASGQVVHVPCDTNQKDLSFALLEIRAGQYIRNLTNLVALDQGRIKVGPLEAGDYQLLDQRTGYRQRIRVTDGTARGSYLFGKWRTLETRNQDPLFVRDLEVSEDKLRIQLDGNGNHARVHVLATRFQPAFDAYSEFARVGDIEPLMTRKAIQFSSYIAGRSIGEEYQYILERQFHEKYPGNMLTRPSLLLNPWSLRTTENEVQVAESGERFQGGATGADSDARRESKEQGASDANSDFASLDFLADSSVILANLDPDEDGLLEIDLERFRDKQMIRIVVQNQFHTLVRNVFLPESVLEYRDLRLADGLDPEGHFSQQKRYSVLNQGEDFLLDNISSARFQHYDDLADVYRYFVTLTGNEHLVEFGFLMDWPNKSAEEKLELYKRHACHEFNFFLMHKDPDYFQSAIIPYLANKVHKTFLDEYLLDQALESWLDPWDFQLLNTTEQILLGDRAQDHRSRLNQLIQDDYDNHPTSRRVFDRYYDFAVLGSALEGDAQSLERAEQFKKERQMLRDRVAADLGQMETEVAAMPNEDAAPRGGGRAGRELNLPTPTAAAPARRGRTRRGATTLGIEDAEGLAVVDKFAYSEDQTRKAGKGINLSEEADVGLGGGGGGFGGGGGGRFRAYSQQQLDEKRKDLRQFYQRVKPTLEWVESNYYRIPMEQQNRQRVTINRFWRDYAMHNQSEPFLSPFFAESSRNFTEMMLALAVLDLPFEAPEQEFAYDNDAMSLVPANDLIAFYEQVRPSAFDRGESTILISENFYRSDDRYQVVEGKQREKFVRKEFLSNVLYGGQIVITNPTSTPQEIDLLIQIPEGAIQANGSHETRTMQMDLAAFSTQTLDYYFYFPAAGDYAHFPAHVSIESRTVAVADGLRFNVVDSLSEVDTESWAYLSQNGTDEQVLAYLGSENLQAIDLSKIAFRMQDAEMYRQVIDLLQERFAFDATLWSYSLKHNAPEDIAQYLQHRNSFVASCGTWLDSPLLGIRPVIRNMYQHREYWPLINARAHKLGPNRKILNDAIWQQYHQLLHIIARQSTPGDEENLAMTVYLLLQDRIGEAIDRFSQVSVNNLRSRLQYDYCAAYLAMYQENPEAAEQIAARYVNYPIQRWRELFASVTAQVREIQGADTALVNEDDATQRQTVAASKTPGFEFVVESLKTKINHQNLDKVTINYYQMDVELLFSRNPFVQKQDDSFAMIKPNHSEVIQLDADEDVTEVDLPEQFRTSNVLVEVSGAGKTSRQAYYANSMNVQTIEQYGQIAVTKAEVGSRLSSVYVKVYARMADGSARFYKDGYTDLRGRFDYASLSNQNLNDVDRFAILVISPEFGAVVREASVPQE